MAAELTELDNNWRNKGDDIDNKGEASSEAKLKKRVNQLNTYQLVPMANLLTQTGQLYKNIIDLFKFINDESIFNSNIKAEIEKNPAVAKAISIANYTP